MKRKTMALLLALSMCLSLLSACGSGDTAADDPPESENAASSTEQQPDESKQPEESEEQPEESEEPKEEEPEESAEPVQEEPKEESNAGTEFLALLQEEYKNEFIKGERQGHAYFQCLRPGNNAFIHNGVVYIVESKYTSDGAQTNGLQDFGYSYDIASKEFNKLTYQGRPEEFYLMNDAIYWRSYVDGNYRIWMYDCNGDLQESSYLLDGDFSERNNMIFFAEGILLVAAGGRSHILLSYELEKIADISVPQREIEHGLKEDVPLYGANMIVADGTVYAAYPYEYEKYLFYRLNTDTYEWEPLEWGSYDSDKLFPGNREFFGRYLADSNGICNRITGEMVFEYGELYPPCNGLSYFGSDKYLGRSKSEYRWVNLTDLSMSDPLPFPDKKDFIILDDTYCVYEDDYGWFLWNYNTGEEETIYMFEQ